MKIMIAVPQDEEVGGVSYVVRNLARYLKSRGHEVVFLFPGKAFVTKPKTTSLGFPGFEIRMQLAFGERHWLVSILVFVILFPVGVFQLIRLMQKQRTQIINIHYPTDCFFYVAVCSRLLSIPLVTSVHGADVVPNGERQARYSREFTFLLSSSNLIVAPSRHFKNDFHRIFPTLEAKTTFIHNGVDLSEFEWQLPDIDKPAVPYLLCVSAYKEQKAIDVLIRAVQRVRETHPSVKLVLVGAGHLREELETLAAGLGLRDQIQFLGRQGRREIIRLLWGCKVFVLPSRFETFGIAVLEAMVCGKPVIATTAGGIPEIVQSGRNGILVRPDDPNALAQAIDKILADEILQSRLGSNGFKTAREQFNFARTATAYEAVLRRFQTNRAATSELEAANTGF
jgi:glycosyltransferase involved in cell wall biosynthesis